MFKTWKKVFIHINIFLPDPLLIKTHPPTPPPPPLPPLINTWRLTSLLDSPPPHFLALKSTWIYWMKIDSYKSFVPTMWLEIPLHRFEICLHLRELQTRVFLLCAKTTYQTYRTYKAYPPLSYDFSPLSYDFSHKKW